MKHLIVIGGPTASGKTALAIQLAQHYGTEIISADSRQFYRELCIGNARPSEEELDAAPHHFIADRSVTAPLSAGAFADEALVRLADLHARHDVVIAVGGSGLYLRALCEGLDEFPPVTPEATLAVAALEEREGLPGLQRAVEQVDPVYYATVDRQNGRRLQRALRVSYSADRPYSSFLGQRVERPFISHCFMPRIDRTLLYRHIEGRVRRMLENGLEAEARKLYPLRDLRPMQTVGYQEWWPYIVGEGTIGEVQMLIERNSRRYAKRQLTWFREYQSVDDLSEIVKSVRNI
ncbi:tRNA dimethylallyltransferase [Neolewinella maritima]|uniref:tRNA dimethylallyltransferase n=1 Tax=Neolewinella maritima TaxID=1383882 RepID=A0ABM9B009_9BACT|nr:tRNA (adenosine(37)-N6)-dimethylallyltransferase MiaA [Neolewinella maritima]CAH1000056.1 tRNA dimethylallyltransferase [Neolewinella maritima]